VQRQLHALIHVGRAHVVQPAADHQPAVKGPQEAGKALGLIVHGVPLAHRRAPADRPPVVLGHADIHAPIQQHVKGQAAAGAELGHAQAAGRAVIQRQQAHAAQLGYVRGVLQQLAPGPCLAIECCHRDTSSLMLLIACGHLAPRARHLLRRSVHTVIRLPAMISPPPSSWARLNGSPSQRTPISAPKKGSILKKAVALAGPTRRTPSFQAR